MPRRADWNPQQTRFYLEEAREELRHDPNFQRSWPSDPLWPWLARELVKLKKHHVTVPEWWADRTRAASGRFLHDILPRTTADYGGLLGLAPVLSQWQREERIDLGKWRLLEAMKEVEDWTSSRIEVPPGKVVFEWEDGWTVHDITDDPDCLDAEGNVMQHCVSSEWDTGYVTLYSLRDPKGRPHVTMELSLPFRRFTQVYGKQNRAPIPEYMERVDEFAASLDLSPADGLTENEREFFTEYFLTNGEPPSFPFPGASPAREPRDREAARAMVLQEGAWRDAFADVAVDAVDAYLEEQGYVESWTPEGWAPQPKDLFVWLERLFVETMGTRRGTP